MSRKNIILIYIIATIFGVILQNIAIATAYEERGYFAVGGDWLVLPMILLFVSIFLDWWINWKSREDNY